MRKAGRRADDHDRVAVDRGADRGDVRAQVGRCRHAANLEVHQSGRLVEGGMGRVRREDVAAMRMILAPCPRPVATGLHGLDDALGAACGHEAARLGRAMQQVKRRLDHLVFHALDAGECAARTQRVLREELEERIAPHLVGFLRRLEDVKRRAAMLPVGVAGLHRTHLGQDFVVAASLGWKRNAHGDAPPSLRTSILTELKPHTRVRQW